MSLLHSPMNVLPTFPHSQTNVTSEPTMVWEGAFYQFSSVQFSSVQFGSVQFKMVSMRWGKSIYALRPVSREFPQYCL